MKAVVVRRFGAPGVLKLESVPDPRPAFGEVVIDVRYASVTFVETQIRAGRPPNSAMTPSLPVILGNGVGGVISELGDGVDRTLRNRVVVSTTGGSGGYAERVAVDAALPIEIPERVGIRDAVAVLADGRTALALVEAARIKRQDVVVVEAAAGGVGSCLVQLARQAGATVVGCVGSAEKLPVAEALGAACAVDYSQVGWAAQVRAAVGAVDVVFDGVGGEIGATALGLLHPEGRLCQYGMASGSFTDTAALDRAVEIVRGTALSPMRSRELSAEALRRAAAGELAATIGQEYPLEQAAAAHAAIEARATIGKTLLRVGGQNGGLR